MGYYVNKDCDGGPIGRYIRACFLEKETLVMLKGLACVVLDIDTFETKESTVIHLEGYDLFTGKKIEEDCHPLQLLLLPKFGQSLYKLVDIKDDGIVTLMNKNSDTRTDLRFRKKDFVPIIKDQLENGYTITVAVLSVFGLEVCGGWICEEDMIDFHGRYVVRGPQDRHICFCPHLSHCPLTTTGATAGDHTVQRQQDRVQAEPSQEDHAVVDAGRCSVVHGPPEATPGGNTVRLRQWSRVQAEPSREVSAGQESTRDCEHLNSLFGKIQSYLNFW